MSTSAMPPSFPKGRAKACTSCRQVKLKCNARDVFPAPCSRCKTQKLECKMDSTFRRVPARRQLEEVSTRLSDLQASLGLDQHTSLSVSTRDNSEANPNQVLNALHWKPISHETSGSSTLGFNKSPSSGEEQTFTKRWLMLRNPREEGSWPVAQMNVNADTVLSLFGHFDKYLSPHTAFLEPCKSLHEYYQSSKTLFWTIILVACREHPVHNGLYPKLQPYVQAVLSSGSTDLSQPLKTLHAILLICMWPFPTQSQSDDPTMIWIGVAASFAMMKGLHKPGLEMEYGRPMHPYQGEMSFQKATWLVIFQISTSQTSWFGMPPLLNSTSHLSTIGALCKDPTISRDLAVRADIQHHIARYMTALDCELDSRTRNSLIRLFERDLDLMRKSFEDVWSGAVEIEFLSAKLYLYGMSFVSSTSDDAEANLETPDTSAQEFLQRGLTAAIRLLYTVRHLSLPGPAYSATAGSRQEDSGSMNYARQLIYYPKHFFRLIAFATFFLLWFLAVDLGASEQDKELARDYVAAVYRLFISFEHSPEHLRFGKTIEVIGRMPKIANLDATLRVNSRLGASFMYDIIRNAVLYREASRHARDVHMLLPNYRGENIALSPASLQEATLNYQNSLSHHVQNEISPEMHCDVQIPYGQAEVSGGQAPFDQSQSPKSHQGITPSTEFHFPWGLWDDAVYDSLHIEADLSQLSSYDDIDFMQ